ncbi:MAG: ABC transporter permease subunit [Desulfurococcales archaeon]|nr:ABC transporter permease subunit [Desulfurococcales archaeon]
MERRLPAKKPPNNTGHRLLQGLGWIYLTIFLLAVWIVLSRSYPQLIPTPTATIEALESYGTARILHAVRITLANSLIGYAIALGLAVLSVLLSYASRHLEAFFNALNTLVQSISVLVWAIVLVMIFGVTSRKPPILVVTAATYPVLLSSLFGAVRSIDSRIMLLARSLGAGKWEELFYFVLPGTIPYLAAASRTAIGIALRISVVAEAFGSSGGVGYWLVFSYDYGYKEGVFAWALVLVVLMIAVDMLLLRPVERWSEKWKL